MVPKPSCSITCIRRCASRGRNVSGRNRRIPLECSGGITLENIHAYAETGVISSESAPSRRQARDTSFRMSPCLTHLLKEDASSKDRAHTLQRGRSRPLAKPKGTYVELFWLLETKIGIDKSLTLNVLQVNELLVGRNVSSETRALSSAARDLAWNVSVPHATNLMIVASAILMSLVSVKLVDGHKAHRV